MSELAVGSKGKTRRSRTVIGLKVLAIIERCEWTQLTMFLIVISRKNKEKCRNFSGWLLKQVLHFFSKDNQKVSLSLLPPKSRPSSFCERVFEEAFEHLLSKQRKCADAVVRARLSEKRKKFRQV